MIKVIKIFSGFKKADSYAQMENGWDNSIGVGHFPGFGGI